MSVRITIECDFCGYSYSKEEHEYCPKCLEEEELLEEEDDFYPNNRPYCDDF